MGLAMQSAYQDTRLLALPTGLLCCLLVYVICIAGHMVSVPQKSE